MTKLNSKLEAEGAEFLVLGNLLVEGITSYKAYNYQKGFDLVATWPDKRKSARIQVKSRYASDASHFLIKSFDCDFIVLVALNREHRYYARKGEDGTNVPEFFVFTSQEAVEHFKTTNWGGKIPWKRDEFSKFKNRWEIIKKFGESNL
jgi:hypothetical protein